MGHPGYRWLLHAEDGKWRWRALDRDRGAIMVEGTADSRAKAAACLARTLTLGVLATFQEEGRP